ncbi:dyslexia-associated protein KIAA0319 isoform X7 [Xiphophorus couchianus]|uniref:dyslexia-associated protein KIAA0319 isoform X7 n=1 Tax=Xiphophorus couchianus TaxID=32473 RepID=UPI001016F370|nr:dyslexia-associated protein KIAA0319-like isoform X7 [Xiphophorus couchianus]
MTRVFSLLRDALSGSGSGQPAGWVEENREENRGRVLFLLLFLLLLLLQVGQHPSRAADLRQEREAAEPHSATMWRKPVLLLLLHIMEAAVAPPCWQGATFPEAVVSPAADSSGIVRVPAAASLQLCVAACCDLPDCDLAWRFKGRCYVLSCQQGADCRPRVRPGADSVLAFLQRPARSLLRSLGRPAPFGRTRGPGGHPEALKGPAMFDGPDPTWSDPADLEADWFWSTFNQSQEADPGGAESDSNLTGTRTTEPAGPAAAEGTAGSQRPELPAPVADSAPTGHMTTPGDVISTTVNPGHPVGDPVDPVDLGSAVTSEPTGSSEVGNRTSEPLKVLQAPTTDPLKEVTSDLPTSAALPPTTVGSVCRPAAAEPQGPNRAPLAAVGPDLHLVLPLSASLLLNGSGSTDDRGVSGYSWEVLSGPPGLRLQDADQAVAMATGLRAGRYTFKLTVSDQQGATDSALLSVRVQEACELSCSGRGQCDPITKQCSCDPFWTENLIRLYLGDGESNCEWRVLFVILSSFLMMVLILSLSWTFVCCSRRRKQRKGRKKTRYTILDDMDEQERLELRPRFSLKHRSTEHNSSLMMSESELDSDQDSVFSRPVRNRNQVSSQAARNGNAFG